MAELSVSRDQLSALIGAAGCAADAESLDLLRVGRNPVWRVSANDDVFYCKICPSVAELRREASGYRLAEAIAREDDRFVAASVLSTDEEQRLLLTRPVPGTPVVDWLKAAYRIDKNPLKRRSRLDAIADVLDLVCEWLRRLHECPPELCQELCDHNMGAIGDRINRVVNRMHNGATIAELLEFADLPPLTDIADAGLTFGDCTLGNFFTDGARLGAIDFEDIGVGSPRRDFSNLRDGIGEALDNPYYYADAKLLDAIYVSNGSMIDIAIQLERKILRYEMALQESVAAARRQKSLARHILAQAEQLRASLAH